jgi:hypothetical protein
MGYMKVIENPDLVRTKDSSAILNTNLDALNKYREEREQRRKLNEIAQEYDQLKADVGEIKSMLTKILGHIDR